MGIHIGDILVDDDGRFWLYSKWMDKRIIKLMNYRTGELVPMSLPELEQLVKDGLWTCYPYNTDRRQLPLEMQGKLIRYMNPHLYLP